MNLPDSDCESFIRLDQYLKVQGVCATGGQAKVLIQQGSVEVNGAVELRRGRKLYPGDLVAVGNLEWKVTAAD